jgi:hypothetical protein
MSAGRWSGALTGGILTPIPSGNSFHDSPNRAERRELWPRLVQAAILNVGCWMVLALDEPLGPGQIAALLFTLAGGGLGRRW